MLERIARAGIESMAVVAVTVFAVGCGGGPSSLLQDSTVQAGLEDLASRDNSFENCAAYAAEFAKSSFASEMDAYGSTTAPSLVGTWTYSGCLESDSNTYPASTECAGSVTWTEESGGRITQENMGAATEGSGDVGYIINAGGGAYIVQENHATGEGCEQDLVNIIAIGTQGGGERSFAAISVVKSSSCTSAKWVCSGAHISMSASE